MKISFLGGQGTATGSLFLIEVGDKKILIDCGLFQGEKYGTDLNREAFPFNASEISYIFVTHAHLDHVGRIPKMIKEGFSGEIVSTAPTRDMAELILLDSYKILSKEALRENLEPLYEERDVFSAMPLWKTVKYHEKYSIETSAGNATFEYYDSGHILGSGIIVIEHEGKRLALTGDLGNTPSPLMYDTEVPEDIDYLVCESVYGDRNHEDYDERVALFKEAILSTLKRKGVLMIPTFSIERAQEMLFFLDQMVLKGDLPEVPIFLDSPLAINITKVYKKYENDLNDGAREVIRNGDDFFNFKGLVKTVSPDESKAILHSPSPKIILAGSGMSNGGRILHHEKNYLSHHENSLLLVGYQAVGTLGRLLQEGIKKVTIKGDEIKVEARILQIHGFSAHKDSDNLLDWATRVAEKGRIKKFYFVLGELKSSMYLAQRVREHTGISVSVPEKGESFTLW
jgi:metallo-beta-lactamase family protein